MAKGVPILGKDPLGKAKYANVTESGDLRVQLSGTLTELEQARALLDAISGKDFATQTTLAAVLAKLANLESELATIKANQLSGDQKVQLSGASGNVILPATEDKLEQVRQLLTGVATEAKLEQARGLLASISGKDFATQATLAQVQSELALVKAELQEIKANQLSGDQKVQLSGTVAKLIAYDKKMWDEITNYTYGIAGVGSSGIFDAVDAQKDRIIDISEFSEISILIINNLDKALENQVGSLGVNGKVVFSTLPKTHFQTLIPSYRESHEGGEYILLETIPAGARLNLKLADMAPYQSLTVMVSSVRGVSAGSLEIMIGGGLK